MFADIWQYLVALYEVTASEPIVKVIQFLIAIISSLHLDGEGPRQAVVNNGQSFDFIVVGAGSAGCVLANRLTEILNWDILLIEAGDIAHFSSRIPGLFSLVDHSDTDWNFYSEDDHYSSQEHESKTVHMTRGKMIGGCSEVNYMYYVRGNSEDYNSWRKIIKDDGWGWDGVLPFFKKSERLNDIDIYRNDTEGLHGLDGPIGVTKPSWVEIQKYLDIFKENGHKVMLDTNIKQPMGYGYPQFTIDRDIRQSAFVGYLSPILNRTNLSVLKNTLVRKVLFNGKKAIGVEVRLPNGDIIHVRAKKEVILSAGAVKTPQILMLSGIGPRQHLLKFGLSVIVDSPYVGRNLMDHVIAPVMIADEEDPSSIVENLKLIANLNKFPTPSFFGYEALNKSQPYPDYQSTVFPIPAYSPVAVSICVHVFRLKPQICLEMDKATKARRTLFAILALLHPKSRGRIELRSNDPEDRPKIFTGYFSNMEDLETHAKCVEKYISVLNTRYYKKVKGHVVNFKIPDCKHLEFGSHEYWKCHVLSLATTQWHLSGTCGITSKRKGVLDLQLRVRGVKSLRVVDASVFPSTVSGNINAVVYMVAEKAACMIKRHFNYNSTEC